MVFVFLSFFFFPSSILTLYPGIGKVNAGLLIALQEQLKSDISFIGKVMYFPQLQLFGKVWLVLL